MVCIRKHKRRKNKIVIEVMPSFSWGGVPWCRWGTRGSIEWRR